MKLIRVAEDVYRSEDGEIHIFKRPWKDKELPWVACYTNLYSSRVEKKFRTLAEVKAAMQNGSI